MRKRIVLILLSFALLYMSTPPAVIVRGSETGAYNVYVNAKKLRDVTAQTVDETVLIPAREVFESLGYRVECSGGKLTAFNGIDTIIFSNGSDIVEIDGSRGTGCVEAGRDILVTDGNAIVPFDIITKTDGSKATVDDGKVVISAYERDEWWYRYPTQAEASRVDGDNARVSVQNYGADPSWGLYTQRLSFEEQRADIQQKKQQGKRLVGYMEATGTTEVYAVGYAEQPSETSSSVFPADSKRGLPEAARPLLNAWAILSSGVTLDGLNSLNYRTYTGIHSSINDEPISQPGYSTQTIDYGEITYPDGSSARGYNEDTQTYPYPLNAKIYDAVCAKNIDGYVAGGIGGGLVGEGTTELEIAQREGLSKLLVGSPLLPARADETGAAIAEGTPFYFGMASFFKDPAAPFWKTYNQASLHETMKFDVDGLWVDNMSPWDNFTGMHNMFGEWSEALFNEHLQQKYTQTQLSQMGIDDIKQFNIREYFKNNTLSLKDKSWLDNTIWNEYKIFKKTVGRDYLKNLYLSAKEEARSAGKKDGFAIIGNDINVLNHGWTQDGWVDMCGTEISSGWNLAMGSSGVGFPGDGGRMAIMYRTLIENQRAPYSCVWFYGKGENYTNYTKKTNLGKVWLAEGFANGALIKDAENTVGTAESHRWLNDFIEREGDRLQARYPVYDIGILYSPSTQLANSYPNKNLYTNQNQQYHLQSVFGFEHAFIDSNVPYRILPEWKLNRQSLAEIKVLIVPNVEVMDERTVALLKEFVQRGGRLVITGASGLRKGEDSAFEKYEVNPLNELVGQDVSQGFQTGDSYQVENNPSVIENTLGIGKVLWVKSPIGHNYYINKNNRDAVRPTILSLAGEGVRDLLDGQNLPQTVSAYVWSTADASERYVDLVNYDVDEESDVLTPAVGLRFEVEAPMGDGGIEVTAISPDKGEFMPDWERNEATGKLSIGIDQLEVLTTVIIKRNPAGLERDSIKMRDSFDCAPVGSVDGTTLMNSESTYFSPTICSSYVGENTWSVIEGEDAISGRSLLLDKYSDDFNTNSSSTASLLPLDYAQYGVMQFKVRPLKVQESGVFLLTMTLRDKSGLTEAVRVMDIVRTPDGKAGFSFGGANLDVEEIRAEGETAEVTAVICNPAESPQTICFYLDGKKIKEVPLSLKNSAVSYIYFQKWEPSAGAYNGKYVLDDLNLYIPGETDRLYLSVENTEISPKEGRISAKFLNPLTDAAPFFYLIDREGKQIAADGAVYCPETGYYNLAFGRLPENAQYTLWAEAEDVFGNTEAVCMESIFTKQLYRVAYPTLFCDGEQVNKLTAGEHTFRLLQRIVVCDENADTVMMAAALKKKTENGMRAEIISVDIKEPSGEELWLETEFAANIPEEELSRYTLYVYLWEEPDRLLPLTLSTAITNIGISDQSDVNALPETKAAVHFCDDFTGEQDGGALVRTDSFFCEENSGYNSGNTAVITADASKAIDGAGVLLSDTYDTFATQMNGDSRLVSCPTGGAAVLQFDIKVDEVQTAGNLKLDVGLTDGETAETVSEIIKTTYSAKKAKYSFKGTRETVTAEPGTVSHIMLVLDSEQGQHGVLDIYMDGVKRGSYSCTRDCSSIGFFRFYRYVIASKNYDGQYTVDNLKGLQLCDKNALTLADISKRSEMTAGESFEVEFSNPVATEPSFVLTRGTKKIVLEVMAQKENRVYTVCIPADAVMESGAVYTLRAETEDIFGNPVANVAGLSVR